MQAVLWTDVFDPGSLTFEALEDLLRKCCAAVFIASPDDETILRDQMIRTPRANTMLEFGLVAGRMGHHSVAICQYGKSQLPSDLAGLTVIRMKAADGGNGQADPPYVGEFLTAHEIRSAVGNKDGSLELTAEAFALQKIQTSGTPPAELSGLDLLPEPWSARWILTPANDLTLSGTVRSQGGILTDGKVTAAKDPVLT